MEQPDGDKPAAPLEVDKITIGQVVGALHRLSMGSTFTIIGALLALVCLCVRVGYTIGLGPDGQFGATLRTPFNFTIQKSEHIQELPAIGKVLKNVYAVLDDRGPKIGQARMYEVRILVGDGSSTDHVGAMTVTAPEDVGVWDGVRRLLSIPESLLFGTANAQAQFDWRGHEKRTDFVEVRKGERQYERRYSDGSVVIYETDESGKSKPSSFNWVQVPRK